MRQQTLHLVSHLARWCQVREDLLYAFEKSLESGLSEPMNSFVQQLLTRIHGGMETNKALQLLADTTDDEHFRDLITALRFNFNYRGHLAQFLDHMEMQLYKLEEETVQRRISSARDRKLGWMITGLGPLIFLFRMITDQTTRQLMLETFTGKVVLVISCICFLVAAACMYIVQKRLA